MNKYINNEAARKGSAFITVTLIILVTIWTFKMASINHIETFKKMDEDIINSHLELVKSYAFEYYVEQNEFPGDIVNNKISYSNSLSSNSDIDFQECKIYKLNDMDQILNVQKGVYYVVVKDSIITDVLYKNLN